MTWKWQKSATPNDAVNLAPGTGGIAIFNLKEALKQQGGTVLSSGDGTTYFASSDGITTGASGAGGMNNNSAWWRLELPDGVEIVIQRGTNSNSWRFKVSIAAGFVGGSPSATVPPTATDQQHVIGDDTPTFNNQCLLGDGLYTQHIGFDDEAPYSFFCMFVPSGGGTVRGLSRWTMEAGTYPSQDAAPWIINWATAGLGINGDMYQATTKGEDGIGQGYFKFGLSGEAWVIFPPARYGVATLGDVIVGSPVNPYSGGDELRVIPIERAPGGANDGWKGFLKKEDVRYVMQARSDSTNDVADEGGRRWIVLDHLALRFPTTILPVH